MDMSKIQWGIFVAAVVLLVLVGVSIYAGVWSWDYWGCCDVNSSSKAEIVRNLGLFVLAFVGLGVAVWRGSISIMQENTARRKLDNEEAEKEDKDFETAIIRFGDKESQTLRYAGFLALCDMTRGDPVKYYLKVFDILRVFVEYGNDVIFEKNFFIAVREYEKVTIEILEFVGRLRTTRLILDLEIEKAKKINFENVYIRGEYIEILDAWDGWEVQGGNFNGISFSESALQGLNFKGCYVDTLKINGSLMGLKSGIMPKLPADLQKEGEQLVFRKYNSSPTFENCFFRYNILDWHLSSEINIWDDYEKKDDIVMWIKSSDVKIGGIVAIKGRKLKIYDSQMRDKWLDFKHEITPPLDEWILEEYNSPGLDETLRSLGETIIKWGSTDT